MTDRNIMEKYPLYLGLGTNLGDREANLRTALGKLDDAFGTHWTTLSDFIETEPWGFKSPDRFLNAVVRYDIKIPSAGGDETACLTQAAHRILETCKRIEREMGRTEAPEYDTAGRRIYKSRLIDIDILLFGDLRVDDPDLKIPHPQMHLRPFVMEPLRRIAPEIAAGFRPR